MSTFRDGTESIYRHQQNNTDDIEIGGPAFINAVSYTHLGTKKLRTLGGDLGAAIKGFKKAMNDDDAAAKKGADVDLQAEKLSHKE